MLTPCRVDWEFLGDLNFIKNIVWGGDSTLVSIINLLPG